MRSYQKNQQSIRSLALYLLNIRKQLPFLSACILCTLLLSGCAAPKYEKQELVSTPEIQVLLTREIIDNGVVEKRGFEHPWNVDEMTLDAILSSVTFHYISIIGDKKPIAAFPTIMRETLIPYLVDAFSKATPDEMVYFAYIGSETYLYIAGKNYFTNGVMFVKNNRLNIAFRYLALEGPDRISDMPGAWRLDPRRKPQSAGWTLNEGPGMTLVRPKDTSGFFALKVYPNWIRIDLDENWMAKAPRKKRSPRKKHRKTHHVGRHETYKSGTLITSPPAGSDDEEGIIIRPPKGYFSIKPEMKPKK